LLLTFAAVQQLNDVAELAELYLELFVSALRFAVRKSRSCGRNEKPNCSSFAAV